MTHVTRPLPLPIEQCLQDMHDRHLAVTEGAVASYIPELSKADPRQFGIAMVTVDGRVHTVGDCHVPFTIQSISKAFVFGLALQDHGRDKMLRRVGVEPSGDAFNSIVFDQRGNRPFNPMVNAGAIATAAQVKGDGPEERFGRILGFLEGFAGRPLTVDEAVFASEKATGHRNRAIALLELNAGMIDSRVDEHLDLYFRQCSILVTARDLAVMAATLANNGINPLTGRRAIDWRHVKHVVAVMSTCGMYDYSGEWLYRVGLPAKSGVGGGIIAVLPGQFGIGTFSPPLDARGNSVRGIKVCEELSERFGLHMFDTPNTVGNVVVRHYRGDAVTSKRVRPPAEAALLEERGRGIAVFELQGDLHFAGAEQVTHRVLDQAGDAPFLLLDCKRVNYIDQPAAQLLRRLVEDTASGGRLVRLAGVRPEGRLHLALRMAGLADCFATLDAALEWAEDELLGDSAAPGGDVSLERMQALEGMTAAQLSVIAGLATPLAFEPGDVVVRQGDPPDRLYLIAGGRASIHIALPDGRPLRLSTLGAGVHFGEMALLDGGARSAEVRAETALRCHVLEIDRLRRLQHDHGDILIALLTNLARALSLRLRMATLEIRQLER